MSNKINGIGTTATASSTAAPLARTQPVAASGASATPQGSPAAEQVHITGTASKLAALERALRDSPNVDAARVAQLRAAIEQGHYLVKPQVIADQLLRIEQALGQLTHDPRPSGAAGQ